MRSIQCLVCSSLTILSLLLCLGQNSAADSPYGDLSKDQRSPSNLPPLQNSFQQLGFVPSSGPLSSHAAPVDPATLRHRQAQKNSLEHVVAVEQQMSKGKASEAIEVAAVDSLEHVGRSLASVERESSEGTFKPEVVQHPKAEKPGDMRVHGRPEAPKKRVPIFTIVLMTTFMAVAKGLGAIPFFFCGTLTDFWSGIANAIACGVMLAASFDLVHEGQPYGPALVTVGVILGVVFIKYSQEWLSDHEDTVFKGFHGADARKVILILGVMAAHAMGEGSGVGVSFSGDRGWSQGTLVTIAIGLHNIPEGLATATVLVARGASPRAALLWTIATSMPQPLVAIPSFMFVEAFTALLPVALGFAAGCMIWIVFSELLPDALEGIPASKVATAATLSAAWMEALRMFIEGLERPNGELASPVAAHLPSLLPVLLATVPVLVVPGPMAALLASWVPNKAAGLGLSAGTMCMLGLGGLLRLLCASQQRTLDTWGLALAGAATMCVVWVWYRTPTKSPSTNNLSTAQALAAVSPRRDLLEGATNARHWDILSPSSRTVGSKAMLDDGFVTLDLYGVGNRNPTTPGVAAALSNYGKAAAKRSDGGVDVSSGGLLPTAAQGGKGSGGVAGARAAWAALALLLYGFPNGMYLAQAALGTLADITPLMLPSALLGVPTAVASTGLAKSTIGVQPGRIATFATLLAGVGPLCALASLLAQPVGLVSAESLDIDPWRLADKLLAAASGALLLTGLVGIWPLARSLHARRATVGFGLGGLLAGGVCCTLALLCGFTQHCVYPQPSLVI